MLQFEEYKVKLNNLKPEIEGLDKALGIEQAKREVEELEIKSSQPGFWDNPEESQKIVSRMGALKGKVEAYGRMCTLCDDLLTICEMAIEEDDESMLEELETGFKELEETVAEQKLGTLLTGEYDSHNALVSFHAGAGGTEAQDWCAMLYRMYTRWAERHGFTYKIMDYQDGDTAGIKSADILIEGENAYGPQGRERRASSGPHLPVRRIRPPSDLVLGCRGRAGHSGYLRRLRDQAGRLRDAGLPLVRCRRSAHQQDLLCGPTHP